MRGLNTTLRVVMKFDIGIRVLYDLGAAYYRYWNFIYHV